MPLCRLADKFAKKFSKEQTEEIWLLSTSDPGGAVENDAHFARAWGHGVREKGLCHQDPKGPCVSAWWGGPHHPLSPNTWCQQLPRFDFQTWTLVVSAALSQSGLSAFLPISNRLVAQESLLKQTRLERCRFQPALAPPP